MNYTNTKQTNKKLLNNKLILGLNVSKNPNKPIFYKYKGLNDIKKINNELNKNLPLVELIRENAKVKPYIDYDEKVYYTTKQELILFRNEAKKTLLLHLTNIFLNACNVLNCNLSICDVLILDSCRCLTLDKKQYFKYSFHITTNNNKVFNNALECKNILLPELKRQEAKLYNTNHIFKNIDSGVYGKTQRLRTINSHKSFFDLELLKPISHNGGFLKRDKDKNINYLVQYIKDDYIIIETPKNSTSNLGTKPPQSGPVKEIQETKNLKHFNYSKDILKLFFKKGIQSATIKSSYKFNNTLYYNIHYDSNINSCIYGNTEHTRTARGVCIMYAYIFNGSLYTGCRGSKCRRRTNINLGSILERSPLESETEAEQVKEKYLTMNQNNKVNKLCNKFTTDPTKKALLIKSRCGTGKTYLLNQYVKEYINIIESERKRPARILMISTRQSYTRSMCSSSVKELNIISYLDYKENKENDINDIHKVNRLCVSMEGLCGLMLSKWKPYDILIIDESESVCRHLFSSTIKQGSYGTFIRLQQLIKFSKKIILLDADLSEPSLTLINKVNQESIIKINNTYNNNKKDFYFTYDKKDYINDLKSKIILKKRLYIVCLSKTEAEGLRKELTPILNMVNVMEKRDETKNQLIFITGDIGDKQKKQLKNVNNIWINSAIVITTSATGAGVDFNIKNHFHYIYGYITAGCSPPAEFLQITHRVRHPIYNNIKVLIDSKINADFKKSFIYSIENAKHYINEINKTIIKDEILYSYEDEEGFIIEEQKERDTDFTKLTQYNYLNNVMNNNNNNYLLYLKLLIEQHGDTFIKEMKKHRQKATKSEIVNILNNTSISKIDLNATRLKSEKDEKDKQQLKKLGVCKAFNIHTNNRDEDIKEILKTYLKSSSRSIINNILYTHIKNEHRLELKSDLKEFTDESDRVKQNIFNVYRRLLTITKYNYTSKFRIELKDITNIYNQLNITGTELKCLTRTKLNEYKLIQCVFNKYGLKMRNIYDRKTINKKKVNTLTHYEITPDKNIYECVYMKVINNNYYDERLKELTKSYNTYNKLLINNTQSKKLF